MVSLKRIKRVSLVAATLALTVIMPAMAQEAPQSEDANGEESAPYRLKTIVTTAQRIVQDVRDVPVSVTILTSETLDYAKSGGADIRFLSARAPSLIAESSFGRAFPRFYIRGIGNIDFDLNASQPVSLVYDDVPYENPILKGYPVFDLASVEILRGPQGTLFGRNTPGGIIKFDSVKPGGAQGGYIRAVTGSHQTGEVEAAYGGSVHDTVAYRLSGLYQTRDAFVDDTFTGVNDRYEGFEEWAGRAQFLWMPYPGTDILLNLHARGNKGDSRLFRANIIEKGRRGLRDGFNFNQVAFDGDNFLEQDAQGLTLRLDHEINPALDLIFVFGRESAGIESRGDIDGGFGAAWLGTGNFGPGAIPFPSESAGGVDNLDQTTYELRLAFDNGGRLRWQAGLFAFDETLQITSRSYDTLAPGRPENGRAVRNVDTRASSLFASLAFDLTNRLTLAGGARFTDEAKTFRVARQLSPIGQGALGPISGKTGDEQISWDVSATLRQNDALSYYARIAKGFRGPSIQGRLVFGDIVSKAGSETVLSYEAGVKSEFPATGIRANANVFFYTLNDQQLTIVGGTDNTVALFNADKSEGYGFELDIEAVPNDNLLLAVGLSYNKTRIRDDMLIAPGCGAGCTILDPAVYALADGNVQIAQGAPAPSGGQLLGYNISGNSFPNAPEWIATIRARYGVPLAGGELYAYTDWAYKGETNFFLYDSVEFGQEGYWQGGLRIGWQDGAGGLDMAVFVRNLTDEIALTGGIDFNNLTGFVTEPRLWGVALNYRF